MTTQTYFFNGTIRTLEPLTVSIAKSLSKNHQMPRNNGIPYFPSSSLIGAFRSAGTNYIIDQLATLPDPIKLDLNSVYSLFQGYIVDNKISDEISKSRTSTAIDEDEGIRESNPSLSVNGRWGLAGKLGIGSAYASSEDQVQTYEGGFRINIFERNEELLEILSEDDAERYFKLTEDQSAVAVNVGELKKEKTALTKKLRNANDEDKSVIKDQIATIENQIKNAKDERGEGRETIRRPIDSMEAIVANTSLSHRMTLKRGSLIELGLTLYTIANFSRTAQLGGKSRHNWGQVEAEWTVREPQDDFTNKKIGKVGFNEDGFFVEGEILLKAMKEFKDALTSNKFNFTRIV